MFLISHHEKLSTKELALLHSLTGHTGAVTSVCIIPRPEVVVTGALDADMRVWESGSLKVMCSAAQSMPSNRRECDGFLLYVY